MSKYTVYDSLEQASDQQQKWYLTYLKNGYNATDAARTAGYADPQQSGWECRIHFGKLLEEHFSQDAMTATEISARTKRVAEIDVGDMFDEVEVFGSKHLVFSLERCKELGLTHAIKEIEQEEHRIGEMMTSVTTKVKLHDSMQARELLLKLQGKLTNTTTLNLKLQKGFDVAIEALSQEFIHEHDTLERILRTLARAFGFEETASAAPEQSQ
jgi:hypothetical protein